MTAPSTDPAIAPAQTNPPLDDGEKLATLSRGPGLELRIRAKAFKGHRYIDVREWSQKAPDQDWWPVKGRGVTIKRRELEAVIAALAAARMSNDV